jgi:hypothetical protein
VLSVSLCKFASGFEWVQIHSCVALDFGACPRSRISLPLPSSASFPGNHFTPSSSTPHHPAPSFVAFSPRSFRRLLALIARFLAMSHPISNNRALAPIPESSQAHFTPPPISTVPQPGNVPSLLRAMTKLSLFISNIRGADSWQHRLRRLCLLMPWQRSVLLGLVACQQPTGGLLITLSVPFPPKMAGFQSDNSQRMDRGQCKS